MAGNVPTSRTLLRNIRLASSLPILFAFGINPPLGAAFFWYFVFDERFRGLLPSQEVQVALPIYYLILSVTLIQGLAVQNEVQRLKALGWEQRCSTARIIDLLSYLGICIVYPYWCLQKGGTLDVFDPSPSW